MIPLGKNPVLPKRMGYPLIVKSLTYESSSGISQASVVANEEQLEKRVKFIHDTLFTPAIVEQFVNGRELYVGVMGNHRLRVFPVWEMSFANMPADNWHIATERVKWNVDYQKKHGIDTAEAKLGERASRSRSSTSPSAPTGRSSFRLRALRLPHGRDGKSYVIEANPNPQLAEAGGLRAVGTR